MDSTQCVYLHHVFDLGTFYLSSDTVMASFSSRGLAYLEEVPDSDIEAFDTLDDLVDEDHGVRFLGRANPIRSRWASILNDRIDGVSPTGWLLTRRHEFLAALICLNTALVVAQRPLP